MKNTSNEFFYKRLRQLGNVSEKINENKIINSSLIDFKTADDGIVYGIVKENHDYFIKKSTSKNPTVADFTYIGGLQNKSEYQYKSLSEADKQRNFYIKSLNEALNTDRYKSKKTILINEEKSDIKEDSLDDAGKEIETAEKEIENLDSSTKKEKEEKIEPEVSPETTPDPDIEIDSEKIDVPDEKTDAEPKSDETSTEENSSPDALVTKEIEKLVGKLTNKVGETDLTPVQTKSFVNSILTAFKNELTDLDIEDRKQMSDKILKAIPDEETETVPGAGEEVKEEVETCDECGTFESYIKSRGYNDVSECSGMEMADVVSGYANAHNNGMNDGDFKGVAIYITPEILKELTDGYGHNEYAEKLQPFVDNVSEEEKFKYKGFEPVMNIDGIEDSIIEDEETTENLPAEVSPSTEPIIPQETEPSIAPVAQTLGVVSPVKTKTVDVNLNSGTVNVTMSESKLASYIKDRIFNKKSSLNESKKSESLRKIDKIIDEEVKNYKLKINEDQELNELMGFSKKEQFEKLNPNDEKGVNDLFTKVFKDILINPQYGIIKKAAIMAPTNIKYDILKAASLDKNPFGGTLRFENGVLSYKNAAFKDSMVKSKFAGGGAGNKTGFGGASESTVTNKQEVNEFFGNNPAEKFAKLQPNDEKGINDLFNSVFKNILMNKQYGLIAKLAQVASIENKYEILKTAATQDEKPFGGTLRANNDGSLKYQPAKFKDKLVGSQFAGGGTGGKTQLGGV